MILIVVHFVLLVVLELKFAYDIFKEPLLFWEV